MSYAPASTTSMVVCISGVVQNPNTYSITGLTLTFSAAPPTGTNNIGVLYLGIPATSVTTPGNTAYLSSTEFTATAGQTTFTPSGTYQVGFINVIRNGSQLAPSDYTATNGTTVVLNTACTLGDSVVIEVYNLVSVTNALPSTGGTVTGATTFNSTVAVGGAATFSSTATINGGSASGYTGYKNRIINGGMAIDQRYAGASVTPNFSYTLDRWYGLTTQTGKFSVQQNAGSVTPPAGFSNYLGVTSASAYSVISSDTFAILQKIEGFNAADLNYGTANAVTTTLSFWVRSSLTGTFGGSFQNSDSSRSYPFTYTISSANTWEQKSITVAGDTSGTWLKTNGAGLIINFGFGSGATFNSGTANVWASTNTVQPSGTVSVVGTSGATWYITGVQLERGSNATSFEFRDYGRELLMCQRYYQKYSGLGLTFFGYWDATNLALVGFNYPVTPRVAPSAVNVSSVSHFSINNSGVGNPVAISIVLGNSTTSTFELNASVASGGSSTGKACKITSTSASGFVELVGTEL
jgi:hypothetical protein